MQRKSLVLLGGNAQPVKVGAKRRAHPTAPMSLEERRVGKSEALPTEIAPKLPPSSTRAADDSGERHAPGAVRIASEKQQLIGIRLLEVKRSSASPKIRSAGVVAPDETRVYRINSSSDGWIREAYDDATGDMVAQNEPLAAFYTPAFITAQQTYMYILNSMDLLSQEDVEQLSLKHTQLRTAIDNLLNIGVSQSQLDDLAGSRKSAQLVTITAPATGFILARNITVGQRFEAGEELYRIVDLSKIWILADVYGSEMPFIQPDQTARVYSPDLRKEFHAVTSHILPQFDSKSRTMKIRLEAENPGFELRPDMFVDIELNLELPPAVAIPIDAIIHCGARKIVYVDCGNGWFEPRNVKTGWSFGEQVQIVEGLKENERIVVSGNFLIDSESRMKLAASGFYGEIAKDPVCQTNVDSEKSAAAGLRSEYKGLVHYFCSDDCRREFDRQPERFTPKARNTETDALPDRRLEAKSGRSIGKAKQQVNSGGDKTGKAEQAMTGIARDPVCNMPIPEPYSSGHGLTALHAGRTYYFCSRQCKWNFDKDPARFISEDKIDSFLEAASSHGGH